MTELLDYSNPSAMRSALQYRNFRKDAGISVEGECVIYTAYRRDRYAGQD